MAAAAKPPGDPARVAINESSLRAAMRDLRYWQNGHPERQAYNDWISDGWRAVHAGGGGTVHVRAYTRVRDGHVQHVAAHERSAGHRA